MDRARQVFFDSYPDPMWIYHVETLRFLDVNNAATQRYGFTRAEFLGMTIDQIHPEEDVPALRAIADGGQHRLGEPLVTRHRLKSGEVISVQITGHTLIFKGKKAKLVTARNVTRLVQLEQERTDALAREAAARQASDRLAQRFQALFAAVPGKFLVLAPDGFEILAASDAYLQATSNTREELVGNRLFGAFMAGKSRHAPEGERFLRESLERVVATRAPDVMEVQTFPVQRSAAEGGGLEDRYWCAMNTPVIGADGDIVYIFHKVEDVTELARHGDIDMADIPALLDAPSAFEQAVRTRQLKDKAALLEAQVHEMRVAQQLLSMATWTLDLNASRLVVSENFHRLLGTTPATFELTLEGYLSLVHPDDQRAMRESLASFVNAGASNYHIRQRVIRPADNRTIHVMVVGEFHQAANNRTLECIVQDISALVEATQELNKMAVLARIAARVARIGGWEYDIASKRLTWESQTHVIYDLPVGANPDLETAFGYGAPEFAGRIRALFGRCVETGEPFDEVVQIITASGRCIWVRIIGEAVRDGSGMIVAVQGGIQDIDEIVRAQQHTESLSSTLAATLESISDAFLMLDRSWRFTFLNSQAEKLLNRNRASLIGKNVWAEFPELAGTVFESEYQKVMDTGQTARFDQFFAPLGMRFRINAYRVPEGLAIYFSDVTRQYEQESQLRLLQTAVSRMSDVLLITEAEPIDAPGGPRIVYVNEAFERRTGFSREEALGRTPRILQGPKTQREELDRIRRALKEWQPVRTEILNYTKSGEELWLELDIVPIADEKGRYTHWVSVERDVTGRRHADALARINDERFRIMAKATNDVIWDWDLASGTIWWNEGMRTLFGYRLEDLEPGEESWTNRIHPDDRERVLQSIHRAIDGSESSWTSEYRFLHADGRALTVVDRGFVIRDEAGAPVRMMGSMLDITERLELDAQLRQSQKLEAVGHLTGGVAHDFNNLLTVILGNASLLAEMLVNTPRLRTLAEMTETAAARGAELINRMLAFSRRQALEPKIVDVNRLIAGMEVLFRRTLPEDIEFKFVPEGGLWATEVDPGQLEVALLNLVVNARDAMTGGGRLTIETANSSLDEAYARQHHEVAAGEYVMVCVSDCGSGMSEDVLQQVFDPFFTTKEVGKGSGLGLSMVYGFVKQSRGHIKLYSEPGQGTTVKLYFPRTLAVGREAAEPVQNPRVPRGSEHILVVEDDKLVRDHVVAQLRGLGYRVTHAPDGRRALEILPQLPAIALLFTDVVMPGGMSGRDLAREVQRLRPEIKVLFTSGYTENAIVHNGRLDPGVQLLSKPYRRVDLAVKVRQMLDAAAPAA